MSEKFYVNKSEFRGARHFVVSTEKSVHYSTEIEIKIIEPVYEYQVIYRRKGQSLFYLSDLYYLDIDDFYQRGISKNLVGNCELYIPSERERK